MIGGSESVVKHLDPLLKSLAPGQGNVALAPGRDRMNGTAEMGICIAGPLAQGTSLRWCTTGSSRA